MGSKGLQDEEDDAQRPHVDLLAVPALEQNLGRWAVSKMANFNMIFNKQIEI